MSSPKEIMQSRAYRYAEDVLEERILAPKTIRQQAGHFLEELKRAETGRWRYTFDLKAASLPVDFCERFLLPTAGDYDTFHFMPWQCFVDGQAFGWLDRDTGMRRFREVFEETASRHAAPARWGT